MPGLLATPENIAIQQARWRRLNTAPERAALATTADLDAAAVQRDAERAMQGDKFTRGMAEGERSLGLAGQELEIARGKADIRSMQRGADLKDQAFKLGLARRELDASRSANRAALGMGIAGIPLALGQIGVGYMAQQKQEQYVRDLMEHKEEAEMINAATNAMLVKYLTPIVGKGNPAYAQYFGEEM